MSANCKRKQLAEIVSKLRFGKTPALRPSVLRVTSQLCDLMIDPDRVKYAASISDGPIAVAALVVCAALARCLYVCVYVCVCVVRVGCLSVARLLALCSCPC